MGEASLYTHSLAGEKGVEKCWMWDYRGTSLTRKRTPLGPYRSSMPRVLRGS